MEDDLEEELLAVAGRSRGGGKKRGRKNADSSDEDYEMEEQRKPRRKRNAAQARAESDEDGEVGSESDFDDGYDSDLMGDEADRERLASMTELEREMELAERSERRDEIKERRQTARVLKQQQRSAAKASNMRSSTRQKGTDVAKKSAMAELVAAKKAQARKSSKEGKRRGRRGEEEDEEVSDESEYQVSERSEKEASPEGEVEDEDDAPSSVDYSRDRRRDDVYSDEDEAEDDGVMTRHGEEDSEAAEHKHIKEIQVRRFMLEKWQNEPFFERSLPGAVVRIAVGSNRYFLAQIVHVEERPPGSYKDPGLFRVQSPYEFPEKGPKTHKWLYVQRGTSPRLMPMHLVSNHGVTPEEFESWRSQCDKDNRPQITTAEVDEVKDRLHKAQTYVYTTADVTKMVEEKRARGEVGNTAKEKARLVAQRDKAIEEENFELAESLQAQLTEMEGRATLRAERERALRGAGDAEKGKKSLAQVNKQNALKNMENALKNVTSRPEGSRTLTSDGVDPFSRRPTRPMTYWKTRRDDPSEAPADEEASAALAAEVEDEEMEDADTEAPTATATENAAGGIDLNIDLSALQKSTEAALLSNRLLGPHWAARLPTRQDFAGRKTLTLADYKRRQGIV